MIADVSLDPGTIDNPWGAVVALALVVAVFIYYTRKTAGHAKRAADTIEHETRPNSGTSLRDAINRIESTQTEHGARLLALEQAAERRGRLSWRRRPRC